MFFRLSANVFAYARQSSATREKSVSVTRRCAESCGEKSTGSCPTKKSDGLDFGRSGHLYGFGGICTTKPLTDRFGQSH